AAAPRAVGRAARAAHRRAAAGRSSRRRGVRQQEPAIDVEARSGARRGADDHRPRRHCRRRVCADPGQESRCRHRRRGKGAGACHGLAPAARCQDRWARCRRRACGCDHPCAPLGEQPGGPYSKAM
ncbi:MAG: RuvC, partial [uncultured Sphingomonas sp.]